MKIYVDVVFFINFMYDLFLLIAVSFFLKESILLRRFLLGALVGALSIFFLFLPLGDFLLFLLKIGTSILMILVTFSYQNKTLFLKHLLFLYFSSFCLGGFLYFLQNYFHYEKKGFLFFPKEVSIHFYLILILAPIFFFYILRKIWKEKKNFSLIHTIEFEVLGKSFQVEGYLDTGNQVKDPYKKRSIILLYEKGFSPPIEQTIFVPFKTAEGEGLLHCVIPSYLKIDGKEKENYLIGFTKEKINLEGRRCVLPNQIREELE